MKNQMPQNSEIQQESTSDKVEIDEWMTKDFRTLYGSPKGVLKTMQKICIHKESQKREIKYVIRYYY